MWGNKMSLIKRIFVVFFVVALAVIGPLLLMFVSAWLCVKLGWRSYPIYFVCQVAASFLVLGLYNPAKDSVFQHILERITKFDFSRPWIAKFLGAIGNAASILLVNYFAGPFVGAILIKRLGHEGSKAYVYAALADAVCVIIGNTIYILTLQKLLN